MFDKAETALVFQPENALFATRSCNHIQVAIAIQIKRLGIDWNAYASQQLFAPQLAFQGIGRQMKD